MLEGSASSHECVQRLRSPRRPTVGGVVSAPPDDRLANAVVADAVRDWRVRLVRHFLIDIRNAEWLPS